MNPNKTQKQSPTQTNSRLESVPAGTRPVVQENNPVLELQRKIGNQAVLRLLGIPSGNGESSPESKGAGLFRGLSAELNPRVTLQTKLKINAPGDAYEQEADRVAEQVMRMPEPQSVAAREVSGRAAGVQRECACGGTCDECKKKHPQEEHAHVQLKAAGPGNASGMEAPPIVHEVLSSPGQPLDAATRAFMEPRFGRDFSGVRVHTDGKAAGSAKAVGARAYTVGSNVVFGAGEHAPGTGGGQRLLGHELTHVVQQGESGKTSMVQRDPEETGTVPAPPLSEVVDEALHGPREYKPQLNISDPVLHEKDKEFSGPQGALFKKRVEEAAAKVGLDPGLLAASLLAEESRNVYTKTSGKENTARVGADDYIEKEAEIRERIPAAKEVKVTHAGIFINEEGRIIQRGKFDATKAALVGAIYLKHGELKVRDVFEKHGVDFDSLTPELRFAFIRLAMNPGKENVASQIEKFLLTRDIADTAPGILIRTGIREQRRDKPQSGATLVAARGLHLSQEIFGNVFER